MAHDDTKLEAKSRAYDALAESHAELVAALDWALPFAARAKITLSQRVRDNHARVLFKAGEAASQGPRPMTCPRCFGLMVPESDYHGEFRTCLACGYVSYPEPVDITPVPSRKTERLIGRGRRRNSAPPVR